jgi:PAS domain S-box-containing protein
MSSTGGPEYEPMRAMFEQAVTAKAQLRGPSHIFETANPAWFALIGEREVLGLPVADALPELADQGITALFDQVYRSGEPHVRRSMAMKICRALDGGSEERVVDLVIQPLKGPAGCVLGVFVDAADVTDHVRAERAMRESELRHRYAFEAAGVSLWEEDCTDVMALLERLRAQGVTDLRAHLELNPELVHEAVAAVRVTDVNQEALRAFGAETKEELRASLARTFTKESFVVFTEELIALYEGQRSFESEAELCTLGGEPRHFQIRAAFPASSESTRRVLMTLVDVTRRKRTERALRQSEERYRAFVANSSEGIWRYELEEPLDVTLPADTQLEHIYRHARLAELNDTMARMYGFERAEQLVGARLEDTLPRDDEASEAYLRQVIEAGFSCRDVESAEKDQAGQVRHFANTMVPVFEKGKLVRGWGVQRDITARKRVEEALRKSELRFRRLVETAPVGVAISEPNGSVLLANDALLRILGCSRADIEKQPLDWHGFTPAEYLPRDVAHIDQLRRGGLPPPFEKELIRRDGTRVSVLIVARFLPDEGERMVAYAIDITERKRAEEALRRTEKRLGRIFETNLLGVLYFDIDGGVQDANDEFLRIVGYDRDDLNNGIIDWSRMTPSEFQENDVKAVAELRDNGAHPPIEKQYVRKDGSRVWVLVGSAMIDGDTGVGFVLDLTGLKAADAALREADRRKDEFLATLAHELRNPLAPIRNAVHVLRTQPAASQASAAREIIARQVQHMVRLVDDLLEVSRITLGQVNLQREQLTLGQLVRDALDAVGPLIEEAGHELAVHLPAEPLKLHGDATRLSQVFQNLLNNACKYTPRGGRIVLRAERSGNEAVVSVRDTGVGVPREMQTRIFDLFTRIHPVDRIKVSGLGIGLALSKRLVELHGGRIELESAGAGKGSDFRVILPLAEPVEHDAQPRSVESSSIVAGVRRRILVVDDNKDAAESLAMLLQMTGSVVKTAFDGPDALDALDAFDPEIVLLDIGMPGMDGYEVARRMRARARGKDVMLVALTGWGQAEDKRRALEAGFDLHLTKPVDPATLYSVLGGGVGVA